MAGEPTPKLTYDDLCALPDDGVRRELIDGELYEMPSPDKRHQQVVLVLAALFWHFLRDRGGGEAFIAPFDVFLAPSEVVQPDLVFVADADRDVVTDKNIRGAPTLVIEVVSDARRDRVQKRNLYARYHVSEYWIVDPDADRIEVYRLAGDVYAKPEILEPGESVSPSALPDLSIDLDELFAR